MADEREQRERGDSARAAGLVTEEGSAGVRPPRQPRARIAAWCVVALSCVLIACSGVWLATSGALAPAEEAQEEAAPQGSAAASAADEAADEGAAADEKGDDADAAADGADADAGAPSAGAAAADADAAAQASGTAAAPAASSASGGAAASGASAGGSAAGSGAGSGSSSSPQGGGAQGGGQSASAGSGATTGAPAATAPVPNTVTVTVSVDSSAAGSPVGLTRTLTFAQGATVYDALAGACSAAGVSVNASSTAYGVYVSAIGGLAEKEHGAMSGWMYYVNGAYVNAACSSYALHDGDSVSWVYSNVTA